MPTSDKRAEAERRLPAGLRFAFDRLISDYMEASEAHTKDHSRRVNYNILADLILKGWRAGQSSN
jgi:hypothetical protein